MFSARSVMRAATALCAFASIAHVSAAPFSPEKSVSRDTAAGSSYWLASMKHQGTVWGNNDSSYKVFRDVTDFGADPTGAADASTAIQAAIDSGKRCSWGCNSSTVLPAIVYLPPGKYLIGQPVVMDYNTQIVGDATNRPTIWAASNFTGMALFDADPYHYDTASGDAVSYWVNQNNFFRQVRNLVFDFTTSAAPDTAVAIHWQVAQATSLQNIDFLMKEGSGQQGIFMDNGSGGWYSDLFFSGGKVGAFIGSQQFTSRNLRFKNCATAIFMNWNWGWTLSNVTINGGTVGIDASSSPANQTVGSTILSDSTISGTTYGVMTAYDGNNGQNTPVSGGTLIIDNVDMTGVTAAVYQNGTQGGKSILAGGTHIDSWIQGNIYDHSTTKNTQVGFTPNITKAEGLLTNGPMDGMIFGRSKPQYEDTPATNFASAKDAGCKGDGETDDTKCLQDFFDSAANSSKIAFIDHGAYLVSDTVTIPNQLSIVGEVWPLIVADGSKFNDASNPKPVFQVGNPTDTTTGLVEISDLIFETKGPAPGAIMIQWNLASKQGASGMWDTHVRIGGSYGTELQVEQCRGDPTTKADTTKCQGVFLMFHATNTSSNVYLENDWFWVADHDLDDQNQTQISIYSGRGALFESNGPVWLWGTASEHSIIYNYQLSGLTAFFGGFMQTETPYFAPEPIVPQPLAFSQAMGDPSYTICGNDPSPSCMESWGITIVNSQNCLIYGVGMYSFFSNYEQQCVGTHDCQENMIRIQGSQVNMYAATTVGAVNQIRDDRMGDTPVLAADNRNVFGDTLAFYSTG